MGIRSLVSVAAIAVVFCGAARVDAQWTITNLHPAGVGESRAYAVSGTQEAGWVTVGGMLRASLWSGTAASRVELHPAWATSSEANAMSGPLQFGAVTSAGVDRASLWNGSTASHVFLHPAGASHSYLAAAFGSQQVGTATVGGLSHAGLWAGTAASWVDLHPAGATYSNAWGTSGTQQVGDANVGGADHASLWSGTAASWIDLHPTEATRSYAYGIFGTQQVGRARIAGVDRASLWSGTAESRVDLHPTGASSSRAIGTDGARQVGWARVGGVERAGMWSGTAASWVDLSAFLPGGSTAWEGTNAQSIWSDGTTIRIAGWGYNLATERTEALLWTQSLLSPVPPSPTAGALRQNVPNPFNPSTKIAFTLPGGGAARLAVYDVRGRLVRTLLDAPSLAAGDHAVTWDGRADDGRAAAAGAYLYELRAPGVREVRRMTLAK